jgi:alpha-1,2-mannosyltransferase
MTPPLKLAASLWVLLALAVSVKAVLEPAEHTTYPCFEAGARCWLANVDPYTMDSCGHDYRYGPAFAVASAPLAVLPTWLGGMLWYWVTIVAYWCALGALVRWVLPGRWTPQREAIFLTLVWLGAARMIWSAQSNALVFAMVAGAAVAIRRERWWWAALLLAMPAHLKVWPLAAALLLVACWPRQLAWRLVVALLAVGAVPFLTKPWGWVCHEYYQWYCLLVGPAQERHVYRDAWTIWELFQSPVDVRAYLVLQLGAAAAALAFCWRQRRSAAEAGWPLTCILATWAAWQLVFGPGTERNTFGLIAPLSAWGLLTALEENRGRSLMCSAFVLMIVANFGVVERAVADLIPPAVVMHPLGVLLFAAWLFARAVKRPDVALPAAPA